MRLQIGALLDILPTKVCILGGNNVGFFKIPKSKCKYEKHIELVNKDKLSFAENKLYMLDTAYFLTLTLGSQ